jgi:hypothetical protein
VLAEEIGNVIREQGLSVKVIHRDIEREPAKA